MKIATYNVRVDTDYDRDWAWDYRKDDLMQFISAQDWDLFGVQEVLPNQVADLKQLANYQSISAERDGDGHGEGLAIFYRPTQFTLVKSDFFWLSTTPFKVSQDPAAGCRRICLWGLFKDHKSGQELLVANLHLDHISEEARFNGLQVVLKELNPYFERYPSLIIGDFNASREESCHQLLSSLWAAPETLTKEKVSGTFQDFDLTLPLTELIEIDYLYARGLKINSLKFLAERIKGKYPADHFPVEGIIKID